MPTRKLLCLRRAVNKINTSCWIFWASRTIGFGIFFLYLLMLIPSVLQPLSSPISDKVSIGRAHLQALAPILTSGGIIGAILTWLLQTVHETECGVEIGVIYRRKYPHYPVNIFCLVLSTSLCAFCMGSAPISPGWLILILVFNGVGLCTELVYILSMTWSFLLRQSVRKMNTYKYLQNCVQVAWSDTNQLRWDTFELECLIKDLPYASSWYYNCPTGWLLNQWAARYRKIDGQQFRSYVDKVNETSTLVKMIISVLPDQQVACDVLGSFIYNCYLISSSTILPCQAGQQNDLSLPGRRRIDVLLERYGVLDEVDRQFSYITAEEKESLLIWFISSWAIDFFENGGRDNVLSSGNGSNTDKRIQDCMNTITEAIMYANCLHRKRLRDENQSVSNLSSVSNDAIKNINGFILFIWSSALCFYFKNKNPTGDQKTSLILYYEKTAINLLTNADLIESFSTEYSALTMGWLGRLAKHKHRDLKAWLGEILAVADVLRDQPVMTGTNTADKQIEEVYSCLRRMNPCNETKENNGEKNRILEELLAL